MIANLRKWLMKHPVVSQSLKKYADMVIADLPDLVNLLLKSKIPDIGNLPATLLNGKTFSFDLGELQIPGVPVKVPATLNLTVIDANITGLDSVDVFLPPQFVCELPIARRPLVCNGHVWDYSNQIVRTGLGFKSLGINILSSIVIIHDTKNGKGAKTTPDDLVLGLTIDTPRWDVDTTVGIESIDMLKVGSLVTTNVTLLQDCAIGQLRKVRSTHSLPHTTHTPSTHSLPHTHNTHSLAPYSLL
jgi:hypothetical protein